MPGHSRIGFKWLLPAGHSMKRAGVMAMIFAFYLPNLFVWSKKDLPSHKESCSERERTAFNPVTNSLTAGCTAGQSN